MSSKPRPALLVAVVALGAYANALGNGFAYDDVVVVPSNPAVTNPSLSGTLSSPYWPGAAEGQGHYRPVIVGAFALQWALSGGSPMLFHAVNVLAHAAVSVLLLTLLASFVPPFAALAGALVFAVHPVHTEAVAGVVGQAEIYATGAVLLACHLYVAGADWEGARRGLRLVGIALLYVLGLGSKEIAVTLPALLVALELTRQSSTPRPERLLRGAPVYLSLAAVLGAYLVVRTAVLGSTVGEVAAPALSGLSPTQRVLTALTLWPEYVRLLLFPVSLAADYSPALLLPTTGVSGDVILGVLVIVGLAWLAWALRARTPLVSLGVTWFCVTILPVSNLVVPAGMLLAERNLYLPSVGLSLATAGLVAPLPVLLGPRPRRIVLALGLVAGALLTTRTVLRNPTWLDTFTVLNTLAMEHPESYLALRVRAADLVRAGDAEGARAAYEAAVALVPRQYGVLVEVAAFYGHREEWARAEDLLHRAILERPDLPEAYRFLSEYLIRQGRAREGHAAAVRGLAGAGADAELYALLSESYIAAGDLEAAVHARLAALGQAPDSSEDWGRLADLYEALGRAEDARAARARATAADTPLRD